ADATFSAPRLEIFNQGMLEPGDAPTRLAWFIEAGRLDLREFIWIDAHTGVLLPQFSHVAAALDRGISTPSGPRTVRGTHIRTEGGVPRGDNDADKAYDFAGDTFYYYAIQHGRNSFDNQGGTMRSTVHYCPTNNNCNYGNAFWNGTQMVYGNGFSAALDVDAHE